MPGVIAEQQPVAKARKPTKNEQRRAKKKQQKPEPNPTDGVTAHSEPNANKPLQPVAPASNDPIQGVPDVVDVEGLDVDPLFAQYAPVLAKFKEQEEEPEAAAVKKPEVFYDDDENVQSEDEEEAMRKRLSRKARKKANMLTIAELKGSVAKPELVDWTDNSATDPKLLINIKSARNVVPVPSHWSLKREYLSSKRGIEKPHFTLPKFIAETGVSEMREAVLEKNAEATLKQKSRERVSGKVHAPLSIDYAKLWEAFFRRQTKPELTGYGEVYYEGKEYETVQRNLVPGQLSDELREALNMSATAPPPWLVAMQKSGPPPSYPALKIPGVNAPIPPGTSWGYTAGGYGKPPVDNDGNPIWGGDIFGVTDPAKVEEEKRQKRKEASLVIPPQTTLWGEIQPVEDEPEEEEEDEDEEEEEGANEESGTRAPVETPYRGTQTPVSSTVPTEIYGSHTDAGNFNLRKQRYGTDSEAPAPPRAAGQVLNQRATRVEGFFGGDRAYDLSGTRGPPADVPMLGSEHDGSGRKRKAGDLDVSMDVDAVEGDRLTKEQVQKQYEAQRAQQSTGWEEGGSREDFSGLVAEDSAKRQKRDKERERKGRR